MPRPPYYGTICIKAHSMGFIIFLFELPIARMASVLQSSTSPCLLPGDFEISLTEEVESISPALDSRLDL